jgi:anti-sigma B factor antagonist
MIIDRSDVGAVTVLRLDGDLDEHGVEDLRAALLECLTQGRFHLVLNLKQVRFISYMGVGILVDKLRKARAFRGDLKLVGLNVYAERLFRMVGVTSLFETYESECLAISVFQEAA